MVKVVLIFILFSVCTLIGFLYGEFFRKRPIDLKECYKGIMLLQNHVIFNSTPIPEALAEVSYRISYPYNKLLQQVSDNLLYENFHNVSESFKNNYKLLGKDMYLQDEDLKILEDFINSLGESGVYGQEKVFNLALESLKINIDEAEELSKKNTKLYRYLGICFGTMLGILLI